VGPMWASTELEDPDHGDFDELTARARERHPRHDRGPLGPFFCPLPTIDCEEETT